MPCYQSTNLPGGVTTTGRPSYRTEADCLNACKEGACCDGTTCTVKPQCQCQCTTGGNCCGPDTATVGGVTGKVCRGGTKQECDQRGGTWTCGYACSADEKTGIALCSSAQLANPNLPVFKGVGTTCASLNGACCEDGPAGSPPTCSIKTSCECVGQGKTFRGVGTTCEGNPCQCCNSNGTPKSGSGCGLCYCYCTSNGGKVPRFVNVTLSWTWATDRNDCSETINTSVTLSRMGTSLGDGFSIGGTTQCYSWDFTGNGFYVSATSYVGPSNEAITASVIIRNTQCSRPNGDTLRWDFSLSSQKDKKTAQTGIGQGVCFDRHAGATSTQSTVVDGWPANPPHWQGLSGTVSGTITINGFQE